MKNIIFLLFVLATMFISCARKTVPQQTTRPLHPKIAPDRIDQQQYVKKAVILDSSNYNLSNKIPDSSSINNNPNNINTAALAPVVVIDSHGMLQTDAENFPLTVSHNLDSLNQATRAFTPDQAKNLAFRYNEIPPRVLYVPDTLATKGAKGFYYKYKNKFWYWKRNDGYFYLDENYYQ